MSGNFGTGELILYLFVCLFVYKVDFSQMRT